MFTDDPNDRDPDQDELDEADDPEELEAEGDGTEDQGDDEPGSEDGAEAEGQEEGEPEGEPQPNAQGQYILSEAQLQRLISSRTPGPRDATDREEPDPLEADLRATLEDKALPPHFKRLAVNLARRLDRAERTASSAASEAVEVSRIPPERLERVEAVAQRFNLPRRVAHQLVKGQLYDEALARAAKRKQAARDGGGRGGDDPARERPPANPRAGARHTATRPVRNGAGGAGGGPSSSGPAVVLKVPGGGTLRIPKTFASPTEYANFFDKCTEEQRIVLYKARRQGVAGEVRKPAGVRD